MEIEVLGETGLHGPSQPFIWAQRWTHEVENIGAISQWVEESTGHELGREGELGREEEYWEWWFWWQRILQKISNLRNELVIFEVKRDNRISPELPQRLVYNPAWQIVYNIKLEFCVHWMTLSPWERPVSREFEALWRFAGTVGLSRMVENSQWTISLITRKSNVFLRSPGLSGNCKVDLTSF